MHTPTHAYHTQWICPRMSPSHACVFRLTHATPKAILFFPEFSSPRLYDIMQSRSWKTKTKWNNKRCAREIRTQYLKVYLLSPPASPLDFTPRVRREWEEKFEKCPRARIYPYTHAYTHTYTHARYTQLICTRVSPYTFVSTRARTHARQKHLHTINARIYTYTNAYTRTYTYVRVTHWICARSCSWVYATCTRAQKHTGHNQCFCVRMHPHTHEDVVASLRGQFWPRLVTSGMLFWDTNKLRIASVTQKVCENTL